MEITAAERWLTATLKGDTALMAMVSGVYPNRVPPGASYPCVVFQNQAIGDDTIAVGDITVMSNLIYVVKAIGEGESILAIDPIAKRINVLLHDKGGQNIDGYVFECCRQRPFFLPEAAKVGDAIIEYRHLGGVYEMAVQEA